MGHEYPAVSVALACGMIAAPAFWLMAAEETESPSARIAAEILLFCGVVATLSLFF